MDADGKAAVNRAHLRALRESGGLGWVIAPASWTAVTERSAVTALALSVREVAKLRVGCFAPPKSGDSAGSVAARQELRQFHFYCWRFTLVAIRDLQFYALAATSPP